MRVVVVDDHEAVRTGLERVLEASAGFSVVAALPDESGLFALLDRERVDAVVLDYDLDRTDGVSLCLRIKHRPAPPSVVIYSAYAAPGIVLAATVAQADAVVHKAEPVAKLLGVLRRLGRGERVLSPPAPGLLETVASLLDPADLPVMALMLDGAEPHAIAQALTLDEREVVSRARRIVGRLQAGRSRGAAPPAYTASTP
jgi:DNA-binding NarL/FixJ family response regulator